MDLFHVVFQAVTNVIVIVGVVYVIAFIRRIERERQHAFRTPVAAIKGIADAALAQSEEMDVELHAQVEAISALATDALAASERRGGA
jgi:signal transduction histidine kinase